MQHLQKNREGVSLFSCKVSQLVTTHSAPNSTRACRCNPFPLLRLRTVSVTHGVYPPRVHSPHPNSSRCFHIQHASGTQQRLNSIPFLRLFHSVLHSRGSLPTALSLPLPRTMLPVQSCARSYQGDCMTGRSDVLAQGRRFCRGTLHRALFSAIVALFIA